MDNIRKQFEAWVRAAHNSWMLDPTDTIPEPSLWLAWQAAYQQGRKDKQTECLRACNLVDTHGNTDRANAISDCMAAIRALDGVGGQETTG